MTSDEAVEPHVNPFGKGKDGKKPPGTRGVYAFLPLAIYYRVQAEASLRQMDVQSFIGKFLSETFSPLIKSPNENTEQQTPCLPQCGKTKGIGLTRKLVIGRDPNSVRNT